MKFQINKEKLLSRLKIVNSVAVKQQTGSLEVLKQIKINIDKNKKQVEMIATNVDLSVNCYLENVDVKTEGSGIIPAQTLTNYINQLPSGDIEIEIKSNETNIVWLGSSKQKNDYRATISNKTKIDEFPNIPQIDQTAKNSLYKGIECKDLKIALGRTLFAASKTTNSPILTGVLVFNKNKNLLITTTDSFRLSESKVTTLAKKVETDSFLVPSQSLRFVESCIDQVDPKSKIDIYSKPDSSQVLFVLDWIKITSRLIEGQYPAYDELIPTPDKYKTVILATRDDLQRAVKLASVFSDRTGGAPVSLECDKSKKGQVKVDTTGTQIGNTKGTQVVAETNGSVKVLFNPVYLSEALDSFKDVDSTKNNKIRIGISDPYKPCVLTKAEDKDGADYRHILMPTKR